MTNERHEILVKIRHLDRYIFLGDSGMVADQVNGEWLRREDVIALIEGREPENAQ